MKEKIKKKEGFIQIPLLTAIIVSIIFISTIATWVVLNKQKKSKFPIDISGQISETVLGKLQLKLEQEQNIVSEESFQPSKELEGENELYSTAQPLYVPEAKTERYQDSKEKLIEELEVYISTEEREKEQTAIKLLAEGQFGEYSGWVAISYLPPSAMEEIIKNEAYLAGEGGYLGKITKNRFDSTSIFNKLGKYGNLLFGDGIWPIFSPNNPFKIISEGKPKIYLSDKTFFACLSIGLVSTDCNNRILNPKRLILYMYKNYNIDEDYLDYIYK